MINGFSIETSPLNEYERKILIPLFVKAFKVKNKMIITNNIICEKLKNLGYKISPSRTRKIINHIRINNLVPCLIATSGGYYVSSDVDEIMTYCESLKQRAEAILAVRNALLKQIRI